MNSAHKSEWVEVPQKDINRPVRISNKDGVDFQFMISPSDIPVACRVLMEPLSAPVSYVIEFKYLSGPEEKKIIDHDDGVRLEIGKLTQKIYKIIIDLAVALKAGGPITFKFEFVIPALERSVEEFEHEGTLRSGNADAIKRFIKIRNEFSDALFG